MAELISSLPTPLSGLRQRTSMILQSEAAECGLACVCMIANHHGDGVTMNSLRQSYSVSMRGATLRDIMDIAGQRRLSSRALKLEPEQLKDLTLPAILHWDMQHFVVLTKVSTTGLTIHDPAVGVRHIDTAAIGNHFTGIALEVFPTADFEPTPAPSGLSLRHFWQKITGLKRNLTLLFVLSMLLQLLAIASPYYMQTVIDDVLLRQQKDLLTVLALGFGLLLCIEVVTTVTRRLTILSLSTRLQMQMSANVFHHLIRLPMSYFAKRHTGDVVSRFGSLAKIREFLSVGLVAGILDGLMAIVTLVVLFIYSPLLAGIVLSVMAVYILTRLSVVGTIKRISTERIAAAAKEQSHFMESVRAIQTVKQSQQESLRQTQWQNHLATTLNSDIRLGRWDIRMSTVNQLLFGIENIVVVYVAALLVMDNVMTVGMLYAFISYKTRFIASLDSLVNQIIELRMLNVHFERLADVVLTEKESLPHNTHHLTDSYDSQSLTLDSISFQYSSAAPFVFRGLSFEFKPGSVTAIVGPSGTGKSTLLKCMMGLMHVSEGSIHYGAHSISHSGGYRKLIASVMQDDQCLSGSIADNISSFAEHADPAQIVQAARQACLHDEIMAMPMQYQTLIGDMGAALSGGQLQRLMIARALYRQPKILFMDEASSNLDLANEAAINAQLTQLNITRIIVAHRPQTISMADEVLLLTEKGLTPLPHAEYQQVSMSSSAMQ